MMRPCELPLTCSLCDQPTRYVDSVPDAIVPGANHPGECGYRLVPLCWTHAMKRKEVATSRVEYVLRCETQGLARVDRNRVSGLCVCEMCGRQYYSHPLDKDHEYMNVLCDGSAVKL